MSAFINKTFKICTDFNISFMAFIQARLEGTKVNERKKKAINNSQRDCLNLHNCKREKGGNSVSVFQTVSNFLKSEHFPWLPNINLTFMKPINTGFMVYDDKRVQTNILILEQ